MFWWETLSENFWVFLEISALFLKYLRFSEIYQQHSSVPIWFCASWTINHNINVNAKFGIIYVRYISPTLPNCRKCFFFIHVIYNKQRISSTYTLISYTYQLLERVFTWLGNGWTKKSIKWSTTLSFLSLKKFWQNSYWQKKAKRSSWRRGAAGRSMKETSLHS